MTPSLVWSLLRNLRHLCLRQFFVLRENFANLCSTIFFAEILSIVFSQGVRMPSIFQLYSFGIAELIDPFSYFGQN